MEKKVGKRTMEEKKNKLLVLVTYTIKTGCVMSPFPPVFVKEREPCCFPFFFLVSSLYTHKKSPISNCSPIPQRRRADNILASALICPF